MNQNHKLQDTNLEHQEMYTSSLQHLIIVNIMYLIIVVDRLLVNYSTITDIIIIVIVIVTAALYKY